MTIVLIPAYKPDEQLIILIQRLREKSFVPIVIDDGSGKEYDSIFEQAKKDADVLRSEKNMGKGAALKLGMKRIQEAYPDCEYFITADSDGQHKVEDVLRVSKALEQGAKMVLTIRDFQGEIPAKSRFGNLLSRWVYTLLTGHYLSDNQSGLRGFTVDNIEWLCKVAGEKYDYELNVIYYADKQHIPISTLPIASLYINGNQSSHFSPAKDTFLIYKQLFTSARGYLIPAVFYEIMVIVIGIIWGYQYWYLTVFLAGIISAGLGFCIEKWIMREMDHKDSVRTFGFAFLRRIIYTAGSGLFGMLLPKVPLLAAFNIIVILVVPFRYLIHKLSGARTLPCKE